MVDHANKHETDILLSSFHHRAKSTAATRNYRHSRSCLNADGPESNRSGHASFGFPLEFS